MRVHPSLLPRKYSGPYFIRLSSSTEPADPLGHIDSPSPPPHGGLVLLTKRRSHSSSSLASGHALFKPISIKEQRSPPVHSSPTSYPRRIMDAQRNKTFFPSIAQASLFEDVGGDIMNNGKEQIGGASRAFTFHPNHTRRRDGVDATFVANTEDMKPSTTDLSPNHLNGSDGECQGIQRLESAAEEEEGGEGEGDSDDETEKRVSLEVVDRNRRSDSLYELMDKVEVDMDHERIVSGSGEDSGRSSGVPWFETTYANSPTDPPIGVNDNDEKRLYFLNEIFQIKREGQQR